MIFASLRRVEGNWAAAVGRERFGDFMDVLKLLSGQDSQQGR